MDETSKRITVVDVGWRPIILLYIIIIVLVQIPSIAANTDGETTTGTTGDLLTTTGTTGSVEWNATLPPIEYNDRCRKHSSCRSCVKDFECGWCDSESYCFYGDPSGGYLKYPDSCDTWYWTQCIVDGTAIAGSDLTYILLGIFVVLIPSIIICLLICCLVRRCLKNKKKKAEGNNNGKKRRSTKDTKESDLVDFAYYKSASKVDIDQLAKLSTATSVASLASQSATSMSRSNSIHSSIPSRTTSHFSTMKKGWSDEDEEEIVIEMQPKEETKGSKRGSRTAEMLYGSGERIV